MIKVERLSKTYNNDVCAIDDISFELPYKGMVCIIGESGSGKSTLLNCLYGAENYDGKIYIDNKLVTQKNVDAIRKQYISMVQQDFGLLEGMTVEENLRLAFESVGEKYSEDDLSNILQKLGLEQRHKTSKCQDLSGGEKQRVAIARALAQKSSIILADEPTGNLDSNNSKAIFELLKKLSNEMLVVVVTHSEKFANEYSDYQIRLLDGKVDNTNLEEVRDLSCEHNLTNRKSSLSPKSFFSIFKWSFNNKIIVILLSIFSIILLVASMMLASFVIVDRNEVIIKNLKYNEEHIISFDVHYNNQIDKGIFANERSACFGYQLNRSMSFHGVMPEGYDEKDVIFIYSQIPNIQKIIECDDISKIGGKMLYGRNPQKSNEIAINQYIAKWMISNGQLYNGEVKTKEEDLLGINISGLEIVGIIDTKLDDKINLAKLDKIDYTNEEIYNLKNMQKIVDVQNLISSDFDSKVMIVGFGYAKENGIENNCYSAYLSSKNENITKILNSFDENTYVKIDGRYTFGLNKVVVFFENNHLLFLILMIAIAICAILFMVATIYISLKDMASNIVILRSIGLDKSKLFYPIISSQTIVVLLQLMGAMIGTLPIFAAINSKIASTLIVPFVTLFENWGFISLISIISIVVTAAFIATYVLHLFSKTINYQKQKN